MSLSYCRLTPDHVAQLVDLEQATFPPIFDVGAPRFTIISRWPRSKGKNYSVAILDKDLLVGYGLMVDHPSDFFPGKEVAYVISTGGTPALSARGGCAADRLAVARGLPDRHTYRGQNARGDRLPHDSAQLADRPQLGFRITRLTEIDRVGTDRMLGVRFDQMYSRSPLLWGAYQSITQVERTRRILRAVPRRALRKICQRMPETALSPRLRQLSYLEQPQMPAQQDSATQH